MELARIDLSGPTIVSDAPPFASGVQQLPQDSWADLTDRGYPGIGYWPIVDIAATYDPLSQELGAPVLTVDEPGKRVTRTPAVIDLPAQQAAANRARATYAGLMAGGLTITSTGMPAMDGTYPVDTASQAKMTSVAAYINANAKFPAGLSSMPIPLLGGRSATVATTTAQYLAIVSAIADFVTAADLALDTGSAFPSASVTIP